MRNRTRFLQLINLLVILINNRLITIGIVDNGYGGHFDELTLIALLFEMETTLTDVTLETT